MTEAWKVIPFLCMVYGCTPKPHSTPPATTCAPACLEGERCVARETYPVKYECIPNLTPPTVPAEPCAGPVVETVYVYCRDFSAWETGRRWDCTPQRAFAPAGGMPTCPEDECRVTCEQRSTGGAPSFVLTGGSGLALIQMKNPWQFQLYGTGSSTLRCFIPARPGVDLCGYEVAR